MTAKKDRLKIRLITVIWGKDFVDMFLRVGLRSLMAEGNLEDLARTHRVIYTIYTTRQDARAIESSSGFARLRTILNVHFSIFAPGEIDSKNFGSHNILWLRGVELAKRNKEIVFFLIPDIIYAKGTLMRWARRFEAGAKALYTPGPPVVLETILPKLESRFQDGEDPISLDDREVLQLLFQHFHPLTTTMLRGNQRRIFHPEYDIRPVPGKGLVMRVLTSNPFCLDPVYFGGIRNFSPSDHLETVAFEPCTTVSLEPLCKHIGWYYRPYSLDGTRLSQLGSWWNYFGVPACVKESKTTYEFSLSQDKAWRAGCQLAIAGSQFLRTQLVSAKTIYRLFAQLEKIGLHQSAAIVATALYAGNLRRRVALRPGAILLVPIDAAFDGDRVWQLLAPGQENRLIDLLRDHILVAGEEITHFRRLQRLGWRKAGEGSKRETAKGLFTLSGLDAEPILKELHMAAGPFYLDGFTIYAIDRVIWRGEAPGLSANMPSPSEVGVENSTVSGAQSDKLGEKNKKLVLEPFPERIGAQQSVEQRATLIGLHVPCVRLPVRLLYPAYFRHKLGVILHNARSSGKRIVGRILERTPGGPALYRFYKRTEYLARRVSQYWRQHGVKATWQRAYEWVRCKLDKESGPAPSATPAKFELPRPTMRSLQEIRFKRALCVIEETIRYYENMVLAGQCGSETLAYARKQLNLLGLGDDQSMPVLEAALRELADANPSWAECWLELGFLLLDQGKSREALPIFQRAATGETTVKAHDQCRDPRAEAHAECGRLFAALTLDKEAANAFASSLAIDGSQSMVRLEQGRSLRRIGRFKEAAECFFSGMHYEESRWCVPNVGRNAAHPAFAD